ncbi:MAG: metalloregulator ArsR/SmtB family transcription factor [Treponema sp.]|jgi:DNA-binding transcriptional ArsR family regulator|nr:metalloregulator ArsR/SmtB family transcription factor [Treponema sp.]
MGEKSKQIAALLKMLANENRLLIFCALMGGALTVTEIAEKTPGITQSALSQHLALLRASGILDCEKSGQNISYRIADTRVREIIRVLKKYYCEKGEEIK